jgi:hypothetical protein
VLENYRSIKKERGRESGGKEKKKRKYRKKRVKVEKK